MRTALSPISQQPTVFSCLFVPQAEAAEEVATARAAEAEKKAAESQALAADKASEVASLESRLERLQRISKQKRSEYDDMQVGCSSFPRPASFEIRFLPAFLHRSAWTDRP